MATKPAATFRTVQVEVIRSPRRRRTVQAQEVEGVVRVSIPATMTKAEEERWVDEMVRRFERRRSTAAVDLEARAATLAARHGLPQPQSIAWADNQRSRWASCTPDDGAIRVSAALVSMPRWVLDYVIVHELAHLVEPAHGPADQTQISFREQWMDKKILQPRGRTEKRRGRDAGGVTPDRALPTPVDKCRPVGFSALRL